MNNRLKTGNTGQVADDGRATVPGGQTSRILVVEDDASLAEAVTTGLMDEGFTVSHSADGDTAWQAIQTSSWELIILDWWLPG